MKALSGSPSEVGPEVSDTVEAKSSKPATLYRVSSDTGSLQVNEIASAPFNACALESGDCFIIDNPADKNIFVWKGNFFKFVFVF